MSDIATIDPPERMSVQEFLQWDDGTDTRYELIDGIPRAMAPPGPRHRTILPRIVARVSRDLPAQCSIETPGCIRFNAEDHWLEPDLAITCGPINPDRPETVNPIIIVEILSPSTRNHDQGFKLDRYKSVESVRDILLVDATRRWVEHWQRDEEGIWRARDHVGSGEIALAGLPMVLAIDALYVGVEP